MVKTTNPHPLAAQQLKLGIEVGVVEVAEVIRWADNLLETEPYNDDIANVSLAEHAPMKKLRLLLEKIADGTSEWDGLRLILGRMHQSLVKRPKKIRGYVRFFTKIWIRNGCTAPSDLHFIRGLETAFLLSKKGIFGSQETVRAALLKDLAQFVQP
ncbi:hypothetical protein [Prosthecobacter sp.]|uniref:hypothetical protein n=1 Tax=Prosthecobacter sp. TaxID=1965333 RepID=UPI0037844FF7